MRSVRLLILFLPFLISNSVNSQDTTGHSDISKIPSQYFDVVSKKANKLQQNLDKESQKVLERMQKQEAKLQKKLAKIDSLATHNIFTNSAEKYNQLKEKLKNTGKLSQYIPKLDTLATSFKFLDQHPEFLKNVKDAKEKLADASDKLNEFREKLKNAEDIKQFLKERKQYLKEQLEKFGFVKELKRINKDVYYYSLQLNEYKELIKDENKLTRKVIDLLSDTKIFKDFMKRNSFLASLFPTPSGNLNGQTAQAGFSALQTRAQVNNFIQQANMGSPNMPQQFQQNISGGQGQINAMRQRLDQLIGGGGGDDLAMPDFKPNSQRVKSFFKRIELGTNFQAQKSTAFFPTTTDIGLSVGYKLNDRSIIGIGASYKVGWGTGWDNIEFTNAGVGLRSFIDWKLKGQLWLTGGYEQNYRTEFNSLDELKNLNAWQKSGLLGLSKIFKLKSKLIKGTKMQFLWDFMSYSQRPQTQPLLFRIGYNF